MKKVKGPTAFSVGHSPKGSPIVNALMGTKLRVKPKYDDDATPPKKKKSKKKSSGRGMEADGDCMEDDA